MKPYKCNLEINEKALKIIEKLNKSGYEAYAVGGCIRDLIMGKIPNDTDICTSALPFQTKEVFSDLPVLETGIKHGTVSVIFENELFEITTFRIDGSYSDGRHPDKVSFTSNLEEDLKRRDFTMNAIAYDGKNLFDPFGGQKDIDSKIIRTVGNPVERFKEDGLRILRALRFSSKLGFKIDESTKSAINSEKCLLENIAVERIFEELKGILKGKNAGTVLEEYCQIIFTVIPEIKEMKDFQQDNPHHIYDAYSHTVKAVESIEDNEVLRLTMLLHDAGKPFVRTYDENGIGHFYNHAEISAEIANKVLHRLKVDNATIKKVVTLIKYHGSAPRQTKKSIKKLLSKIGEENYLDLIKVRKADIEGQSQFKREEKLNALNKEIELFKEIKRDNECFTLKDLAINGSDLTDMFHGKQIGKILDISLNSVISGKVENDREKLLEFISKIDISALL